MPKVARNILHNLWGQGITLLASLLAAGFIARGLGADALGVLYFAGTLCSALFSALEMGICEVTVREVATQRLDDPTYVHDLIRTASLLYWLAYAIIALSIWLLAPWLVEHWIHLGALGPREAINVIRVIGITGPLALPRALYASFLRGLQRMGVTNTIDATATTIQQLGTVLIILAGHGLQVVAAWWAMTFVLATAAYAILAAAVLPATALLPGFAMKVARRNLRFSLHMAATSALGFLHVEVDRLIVSKFMPVGILGYYSVAGRVTRRTGAIAGAISQAAFPSLAALVKTDRVSALGQYHDFQDLACFGTAPLFAGAILAAVPLFSLLFGRETASTLLLPTGLLALGQYMNGALNIPYVFSLAAGRPDIASRQNTLAAVLSLPIAVWLVWRHGLIGAGLSWVIYHLIAYGYGVPRISRECLGIPSIQLLRPVGRALALTALSYGAPWWTAYMIGQTGPAALALVSIVGTLLYVPAAHLMVGQRLQSRIKALFCPLV